MQVICLLLPNWNDLSNVVLWVPSHVRWWCSVASGLTNLGVSASHKSPIRTLRSNQNVPKTDTHVTCHMLEDIFQPLISARFHGCFHFHVPAFDVAIVFVAGCCGCFSPTNINEHHPMRNKTWSNSDKSGRFLMLHLRVLMWHCMVHHDPPVHVKRATSRWWSNILQKERRKIPNLS